MEKNFLIYYLLMTFLSFTSSKAQLISVENGKSLTIKSGASLNASGLVLKPSTDYAIAANNAISKTSVAEVIGNDLSMSRIYTLNNALENYVGAITFQYDDAEMGTITHPDAVLVIKDQNELWHDYADSDGVNNSVTHNFTNPVQIKSVSAASGTALSVEALSKNSFFKVYPNPVVTKINILCKEDIEISIFNQEGQLMLNTREKTIDFSSFANGVYILNGRNTSNQSISNNFKILKQ